MRIPTRRGSCGSSATRATWRTCGSSRCRSSTPSRRGRRRRPGENGSARFEALAPRVLRKPARVLRVLGELKPMGAIGPVSLEEVRDVLSERLRTIDEHPPAHRYGAVFVGSPHQARGRAFRVVFVPGLAERMFPQKPREDPMLLDKEMREPLAAGLAHPGRPRQDRAAAPAAGDRRGDGSFVALLSAHRRRRSAPARALVLRARHHARDHRAHPQPRGAAASRARRRRREARLAGARRVRATPSTTSSTISPTLRDLIDAPNPAAVRGHAHYLLRLNDALRRSVTTRWARARSRWLPQDGLVRVSPGTKAMLALAAARGAAVLAVGPAEIRDVPVSVPALGDLPARAERRTGAAAAAGSADARRALPRGPGGVLPLAAGRRTPAGRRGRHARRAQARRSHARRRGRRLSRAAGAGHRPRVAGRDRRPRTRSSRVGPASCRRLATGARPTSSSASGCRTKDGIRAASAIRSRSTDASSCADRSTSSKRSAGGAQVRVTDHKTGKNRSTPRTVIGGGGMLQPVLYGMAIEQILSKPVVSGRLFYCTAAGGFTEHEIPLNDAEPPRGSRGARDRRPRDRARVPAARARRSRACTWCDFRAVCGPDEEQHVARKPADQLGDLTALRGMP